MIREMSRIIEFNNLSPFSSSNKSEVFIGCASYEERCTGALLSASKDYNPESIIIFYSTEYLNKGKTKDFLELLMQFGITLTNEKPELIDFSVLSQRECLNRLNTSIMEKLHKGFQDIKITIDITTFPRQLLFLLLREVRQIVQANNLRLLYSEPKQYSTEIRQDGWLTKGVRSVTPMFGFGGVQDPMLKKMLVILAGHEGERAYITWRRHQPDKTILIPQGKPYHEGLNNISEEENLLLRSILGGVSLYSQSVPAHEVDEAYLQLERIYARYAHEYYFIITSLGTKLQSLGFFLFAESRPDVQVTYAVPIYYNYTDYSVGIARRWEIKELNPYKSDYRK
jgi:hypothetical protein